MSTSTARDAERFPDTLGVHRVTTFRQASRVASDRAYGFSVFRRSAPGPALAVAVADADDGRRPAVQRNHHQRGSVLSLTGEPVWSVFLVGLLADTLEIGLTPAVFGLALTTLHGGWTCLRCRMVAVARLAPCRWK